MDSPPCLIPGLSKWQSVTAWQDEEAGPPLACAPPGPSLALWLGVEGLRFRRQTRRPEKLRKGKHGWVCRYFYHALLNGIVNMRNDSRSWNGFIYDVGGAWAGGRRGGRGRRSSSPTGASSARDGGNDGDGSFRLRRTRSRGSRLEKDKAENPKLRECRKTHWAFEGVLDTCIKNGLKREKCTYGFFKFISSRWCQLKNLRLKTILFRLFTKKNFNHELK